MCFSFRPPVRTLKVYISTGIPDNIYLYNNNLVVNIGDKNFAEVQFRWNFVQV